MISNYVEPVKNERIMRGALQGLAEGLDPDSAWLTPAQVGVVSRAQAPAKGTVGLELTRQVLPARDRGARRIAGGQGRAGHWRLHPRDQRRADARDVGVGRRMALRGAPGSKVTLTVLRGNAAEPHEVTLVREEAPAATVTGRLARPGVGWFACRRSPSGPRANCGSRRSRCASRAPGT